MQSYSHLYETYQVSCSPAGKRTPSYFLTQTSLQCTNHGVNLFFLRIIVFVYFIKFFFSFPFCLSQRCRWPVAHPDVRGFTQWNASAGVWMCRIGRVHPRGVRLQYKVPCNISILCKYELKMSHGKLCKIVRRPTVHVPPTRPCLVTFFCEVLPFLHLVVINKEVTISMWYQWQITTEGSMVKYIL